MVRLIFIYYCSNALRFPLDALGEVVDERKDAAMMTLEKDVTRYENFGLQDEGGFGLCPSYQPKKVAKTKKKEPSDDEAEEVYDFNDAFDD